MTEPCVLAQLLGRVGLITLNRPAQLNALNDALMNELGVSLLAYDAELDVGAIVITGSDKAFAAGADIPAMVDWSYMDELLSPGDSHRCEAALGSSFQRHSRKFSSP